MNYTDIPCFINCRDRVDDLRRLVDWLERAGSQRIVMLDNDSTYPPLLEFYEQTPHEVVRFESNHGSRSLWRANLVPKDSQFIFTDPDVLPIEDCPLDAIGYLQELMEIHPFPKAGLGLYLDDVPDTLPSLRWERQLVSAEREIREGVYDSMIDTTFALYQPRSHAQGAVSAMRTGYPYQLRHLPWYRIDEPTAEEQFYLARAIRGPYGSSWAQGAQ